MPTLVERAEPLVCMKYTVTYNPKVCSLSTLPKWDYVEFFILDFSVAAHGRSAVSSPHPSLSMCVHIFFLVLLLS